VKARLILQPFDDDLSLYEALELALTDQRMTNFTVVVAWAKGSGLQRIKPLLETFRTRGGTTSILLGIDESGATIEGLRAAINDFDEARVLFDAKSGTFHPKIYLLESDSASTVLLCSNNMTAGGLFANYEAGACLDLDLAIDSDAQLHQMLSHYIERLRDDETSRPLTEELIQELIASARFDIRDEDEARSNYGDSHGLSGHDEGPPLFGSSRHRKKRDPLPVRRQRATTSRSEKNARGTRIEGGSTAEVVVRWNKKLTRSDAGRPRPGSQTTAALRFTQARQPIDQATWFRHNLFVDAQWHSDPSYGGREIADARFDVTINGVPRGTHELQLKYDEARESGQSNFTTDLKWGSLNPILRTEDLVDKWATIEKLSDGSLRLIVADDPVGSFVG
jgi:HKD family nuclease